MYKIWRSLMCRYTIIEVISLRLISIDETDVLMEIAKLHETIPMEYDSNYKVTNLDVELRYASLQLLMQNKNDLIMVVESDCLQAFTWFNIGTTLHIKSTYVYPECRRQGIAMQLKLALEDIAMSHGIHVITSEVSALNKKMQRLNEKLNYRYQGNIMTKSIEVYHD